MLALAGAVPAFVMLKESVAVAPTSSSIPAGRVPTTTRGPPPVTVTVVVAVAEPPGPEAVSVYVVVCCGDTVIAPETGTVPMPLSIDTELAPTVVHANVEGSPNVIALGRAAKLEIAAGVPEDVRVNVNMNDSPGLSFCPVPLSVFPLIVPLKEPSPLGSVTKPLKLLPSSRNVN